MQCLELSAADVKRLLKNYTGGGEGNRGNSGWGKRNSHTVSELTPATDCWQYGCGFTKRNANRNKSGKHFSQ
jgi:hypothetical protein